MRSEERSITLTIYLESSLLHETETPKSVNAESLESKLTFHNIAHPEWAVHALRQTMYVQNIVNSRQSEGDQEQYEITVIYRHERVSNLANFTTMIRMVIENAGVSSPHL